MLSISFKLHLIKHLGTGCAFRDTRRALKHLRHLDVGTRRAFRGHSDGTWSLWLSQGPWTLEQLIKEFNMIRNICSWTRNWDFIDNANTTLNEVFRNGLHLSGKGIYVLINDYLDMVSSFLEVAQYPRTSTHWGTLLWIKTIFFRTIYKYWKMEY